jgi:hypothetical protein
MRFSTILAFVLPLAALAAPTPATRTVAAAAAPSPSADQNGLAGGFTQVKNGIADTETALADALSAAHDAGDSSHIIDLITQSQNDLNAQLPNSAIGVALNNIDLRINQQHVEPDDNECVHPPRW